MTMRVLISVLCCVLANVLAAADFLLSLPTGLDAVPFGVSVDQFAATNRGVVDRMWFGSTNINLSLPNQSLYITHKGSDPQFGFLGSNSFASSIREYTFKRFQLTESRLILGGDREIVLRIQNSIISDCIKKYGDKYERRCSLQSAGSKAERSVPVFRWKTAAHYVALCAHPPSHKDSDPGVIVLSIVHTNNVEMVTLISGEPCSSANKKALFDPILKNLARK